MYQWSYDGSMEQKLKVVYRSSTQSDLLYAMCSSSGNNRAIDVSNQGASLGWFLWMAELLPVLAALFTQTVLSRQPSFTSRNATEAGCFAKTDRIISPEIAEPKISIGETKINDTYLSMQHDSNVLVIPSWIWACKKSNPNLTVPNNSTFHNTTTVMLDGALYPLPTVENCFTF